MSDDERDAFDGEVLDLVVPGTLDGIRIDRVLSMLTGLSRSEAHHVLTSGAVSVNQKVIVKSSTALEEGQHLMAVLPPPVSDEVAPDESVSVEIVLDDTDFAVVNKAPGQVVHPGQDSVRARSWPGSSLGIHRWHCSVPRGSLTPRVRASCIDSTRARQDFSSSRRRPRDS